jgi:hypothetical protein
MYKLLGPDGKEISRFFLQQDLQRVDPVKLQRELERGEYVVDEILAKKKIDGKVKYLVRFVGYPEPEWVSAQKSFAPAIQKFKSQAKQQPQAQKKLPTEPPVIEDEPAVPVTQTRRG